MTAVTIPRGALVDANGLPTRGFQNFLDELLRRVGGSSAGTSVTGPGSATDNAIARFNGTGGGAIQNSVVQVSDAGNFTGVGTFDGVDVGTLKTDFDAHEANTSNPHSVAIGQLVGALKVFQVTVNQSDLASSGSKILLDAAAGEQWKVRHALLSGDGTNFSGGDRLLAITDGTTTWSVIPAATLQSLAAARWGDTGLPFPATALHLTTASAAGTDIVAQYSGGATDYTAGECTIVLIAERVA